MTTRAVGGVTSTERRAGAAATWPSGEIVQRGPVFDFSDRDSALPYVRAELIRHTDDGPIRLLINPFALARSYFGTIR